MWPGDTGLTLRTTNVAIRGFSLRHTIADGTNTSYLFLECAQFLRCALKVKAYQIVPVIRGVLRERAAF